MVNWSPWQMSLTFANFSGDHPEHSQRFGQLLGLPILQLLYAKGQLFGLPTVQNAPGRPSRVHHQKH